MNSYALVYAFLGMAMGAMVYVVGIPWWTPKSHRITWRETQKRVVEEKI